MGEVYVFCNNPYKKDSIKDYYRAMITWSINLNKNCSDRKLETISQNKGP